jgi:uncharacterized protein (DUF1684 family)
MRCRARHGRVIVISRMPWLALLVVLFAGCAGDRPASGGQEYLAEINEYRADRESRLQSENGWLALIGLHWLEPGACAFGADPGNDLILPGDASPPFAGRLVYDGVVVRLVPEPGTDLLIDGEPAGERVLADDAAGRPDVVNLGRLAFHVIRRGDRHAVRVKDPQSPARREFHGLEYFPADPAYRVVSRLRAYDAPQQREVPTVVGTITEMLAPGVLEFELAGTALTLEPFISEPGETSLFLIFRDRTSGSETYGAGRFLYATLEGDRAVLDFNRAVNPPCAFTPFATCPLPPPENRLDIEVRAGEKIYAKH